MRGTCREAAVADVASGMLQHQPMAGGERLAAPAADRTRRGVPSAALKALRRCCYRFPAGTGEAVVCSELPR